MRLYAIGTSFLRSLSVYRNPMCIRMFFLGFSSGLPLLLILGTLSFWLREAGIDLKTIGFMSWIGLIYGCKWLWAPLVDSLKIPFLSNRIGQRKAWLLISQLTVMSGLLGLSMGDPRNGLYCIAVFALITAFASATQDIALDAYRIESADSSLQGALAATYQTGYRLAMIWSGAGAFALASFYGGDNNQYSQASWSFAYIVMALSMVVGLLTTIFSPNPIKKEVAIQTTSKGKRIQRFKNWIQRTCIKPFTDFFYRYRWQAIIILLFIATYRISDIVMGVMSNPFYQDLGFSKQEIATISKVFGLFMTLLGAFAGGILVIRIGLYKALLLGGILSAVSNLLFATLASIGHSIPFLIFTISADNLSSGIASASFIAYLSSLTNTNYSATQYALLSSIMLVLPKFIAGFSGILVETVGYEEFFILTAILGIPSLVTVLCLMRLKV